MSKKTQNISPEVRVFEAVKLEDNLVLDIKRAEAGDAPKNVGATVRTTFEGWMQTVEELGDEYGKRLGGVNPKEVEDNLLAQISKVFPRIASDLGWSKERAAELERRYAEANEVQRNYEQAA